MTDTSTRDTPQGEDPATDCWFLSGPTASGKTSVGLELAKQINAEIISLDSMAIYRGMSIGTAKPTLEQTAEVPHHLLDIADPDSTFSVAQYVEVAHDAIQQIRARGREVLFVGGTPLYLKSLLRGIFEGPPADWEFREQVEAEIEQAGMEALHARLEQVDPISADKLHPNDKRRIIRALEVYKQTGEPISHLQTHFDEGRSAEECKVFVLAWPRPTLHRRIEERVDSMISEGFVEEVRALARDYPELSRTASQAVGYREMLEHIQGRLSLESAIEEVKKRTRQFARRQETWFRSLSETRPLDMDDTLNPIQAASRIVAEIRGARETL